MIRVKRLLVVLIVLLSMSSTFAIADTNTGTPAGADPHAVSLYNLGLSAYKQGSPESAIIFFKRAVDLDPNLADAQYNLGVLYQSEHRLKEAVPRFKEALRVKPEDPDSHYQLGLALIDLNLLTDARQNLMAIAPNSSHFTDAQKKIAAIDTQLANPTATTTISTATSQTSLAPSNNTVTTVVTPTNTVMNEVPSVNQQNLGITPNTSTTTATSTTAVANTIVPQTNIQQVNTSPVAVIDNANVQVVANGFAAPSGLTFDRNGNLYVANFVTNTIDRLSPSGQKSQFSTGINLKGPIGLICDDNNNLYVANYLAGTITRINPAGIAQVIVSGLKKPYYLAMDKEGNLFVSQQEDNTIVRINFAHNGAETVGLSR